MKKIIGLLGLGVVLLSCNGYYKAITVKKPADADCVQTLNMKNKYFILHGDNTAFAMTNISISGDNKKITCSLQSLPDNHIVHTDKNTKLKYKTGGGEYNQSAVLNEVHFYTATPGLTFGPNEILMDNVSKIEVLEKDKPKTNRNKAISWGIAGATVVVIVALAAASSLKTWKY